MSDDEAVPLPPRAPPPHPPPAHESALTVSVRSDVSQHRPGCGEGERKGPFSLHPLLPPPRAFLLLLAI